MDGSTLKMVYPVVLRFEGLYPHQLGGYEAHRLRKGGDLSHVDRERSELNERLHGPEDWAAQALAEIRDMAAENFAAELDSLQKRKRWKDIERRMVDGPKQPWRATRHGPMREVILTVNKDWFEGDALFHGVDPEAREKLFGTKAVAWLKENFGEDLLHARADRDEAAYHIHAVIMPRATVEIAKPKAKVPVASATRRMLQPSIHPLIKDYEAAQDSVGAWFSDLGLVRGEHTAKAIREARETGQKPPKRRHHARTPQWRADEELRLKAEAEALEAEKAKLEERERAVALREEQAETALEAQQADLEAREQQVAAREEEVETVLAVAEGVASGAFVVDDDDAVPQLKQAPKTVATPPPQPLDDLKTRSPKGFARASAVFGRAWARLLHDAQAAATKQVADAMKDIEAADKKIAEAALHLPSRTRDVVAKIRCTIPAILRRLELRSKRRGDAAGPSQNRPQKPLSHDDP